MALRPYLNIVPLTVALSLCQNSAALRIEGTIDLITYGGSALTNVHSLSFPFVCIKGTNTWMIETHFLQNAKEAFYFDGADIYRTLEFTAVPEKIPNSPTARAEFSLADLNRMAFLQITSGDHPLGNAGVNIVWLALCSEKYLKTPGRLIPLPVAEIRNTPNAFAYDDKCTLLTNGNGLPHAIQLIEAPSAL